MFHTLKGVEGFEDMFASPSLRDVGYFALLTKPKVPQKLWNQ